MAYNRLATTLNEDMNIRKSDIEAIQETRLNKAEFQHIIDDYETLKSAAENLGYSVEIQEHKIALCADRVGYSVENLIMNDDNITGLPLVVTIIHSSQLFQSLLVDEKLGEERRKLFKLLWFLANKEAYSTLHAP